MERDVSVTHPLIVSASGIRGIVGHTMTPEITSRYGAAFGAFLRERSGSDAAGHYVLVGRDSRTSGPLLADAVAAGLCGAGVDVRMTGIAPTPTHLLAVRDDPAAIGGLIVTASQNPVEWNGLKLASAAGNIEIATTEDWHISRLHVNFAASLITGEPGTEDVEAIITRMKNCPVSKNLTFSPQAETTLEFRLD